MQKKESVLRVIKETVRKHGVLSAALLGVVCGAVIFALLPPLVLAQLIDLLTKKHTLWMEGLLLYFGLLALTGVGTRESSDGIRPENYTCTPKQSDGKVRTPFRQRAEPPGAGRSRIKICR